MRKCDLNRFLQTVATPAAAALDRAAGVAMQCDNTW